MQKRYGYQICLMKKLQQRFAPYMCEQGTLIAHALQHGCVSFPLHHLEQLRNCSFPESALALPQGVAELGRTLTQSWSG